MPLIIIESPNKKEKVKKYSGFDCEATAGHFCDLKDIEVENNYNVIFDYTESKRANIFRIINKCKGNEVYIATDPDREGYAIGYMFYQKIKNVAKGVYRAEFHEITESGIKKGLKEAVAFNNTNMDYYNSFLARRVIDRLMGFIMSPILSKEITGAKSAGRVQSPALFLIVKRDKEIKEFDSQPAENKLFYYIEAQGVINSKNVTLKNTKDSKEIKYDTKEQAQKIFDEISKNQNALITNIDSKETKQSPAKPFTTSKLLKKASKALKISTEKVQKLAQELFEAGLITYIRTDSEFISKEFLTEMQNFYAPIYKDNYEYREYKAGSNSQAEAHEAIRITHCHKIEDLESIVRKEKTDKTLIDIDNAIKLYKLIFINTIQSQLKNATYKQTKITFNIRLEEFTLNIRQLTNKGFLDLEPNSQDSQNDESSDEESTFIDDNSLLTNLTVNNTIPISAIKIKEGHKNPPKLYSEADFIEVLEKNQIGRPSTYATYIPKLLARNYIEIDKKGNLKSTLLGISVIEFLEKTKKYNFVIDIDFTKKMEEKLDLIKDKKYNHLSLIKEIHHRLDFIPLKKTNDGSNIKPPSEKQLKWANDIAEKIKIKLPADAETNFKIAMDFILENKDKVNKKK